MGECPTEWTKINQQKNGVAWGTKNDEYGGWKVSSKICGRKLKLEHKSGKITCAKNAHWSYFGCKSTIAVFVTKGKGSDNVIVPYAGDPKITMHPHHTRTMYSHPVYNAMSTSVEFDLPLSSGNSYFCFEEETEYQLWHCEDLYDYGEFDNNAWKAFTDIYIIS